MDEDISRWVIEFLLRNSPSDQLINRILAIIPISNNNNFRLKKTLLLRSIQSQLSSDGDASPSKTILENLKAIRDLDEKEGIAITRSMEAAIRDAAENTQNDDALRQVVKTYLEEAWASMGPTFLELAAAGGRGRAHVETEDKEKGKGIRKENVQRKRKHVASHRRARGPVRIIDNEDLSSDEPCSQYDTLPTPEVNKVQEALKSSSLELQAIVTDPLPDALRQAEAVVSGMARANQIPEPSVGRETNVDKPVLNPSVNAHLEPLQANQGNRKDESCSHQSNVPKSSLMERNSTAHAYEWDDSIDEEPSNQRNRFHLPSPKRKAVSPLKNQDVTNLARRRKKKKWSLEEEDALRKGVEQFGKGNWKLILKSNPGAFDERTEVDLKDKWRNMTRYSSY